MKVKLSNIGVFKEAEYEIGDLTIICGSNNSGKTYATYMLFGFWDYWHRAYKIKIDKDYINNLFQTGSVLIDLDFYYHNVNNILQDACNKFKQFIPRMLAAKNKMFDNSAISISFSQDEILFVDSFKRNLGNNKNEMVEIIKESKKNELAVSLLMDTKEMLNVSVRNNIITAIQESIKEIMFGNMFTNFFIASAERTGASMFAADLNLDRARIIDEVTSNNEVNIDNLARKLYEVTYALPVRKNLDFIKNIPKITKIDSYISEKQPDILQDFSKIVGGSYKVDKEGINFIPAKTRGIKLSIGESSSSVRSLLDIGFYLKHIAQPGDTLIIDEPELNLHPENQRKLARLFARLINVGIRVFMTTHSDYIIKEINTLIMMNHKSDNNSIKKIMKTYHYQHSELISAERVKVYIACSKPILIKGNTRNINTPVLYPAIIDNFYGIEAESFDKTIDEMAKIQNSVLFER